MIIEAGALLAGMLAIRKLAHHAILRGLRAPRLPHDLDPRPPGVAAGSVRAQRIPGPRGKTLAGWLVLPAEPVEGPAPAVLVMHGWGANASMMWPVVPPLHQAGIAVLLLDARCHGRSDDDSFSSMPRFAEDIAAGLDWLKRQPGIAADRLAVLGHSVGAAAALLQASRRRDVRAVVSLSAFAHPRDLMRRFLSEKRIPYPALGWYVLRHVQNVIGTDFDAIAPTHTISTVSCPVLVVHGRADTVAPVDDAARIAVRSRQARLLLVDGDHDLREALAPHASDVVEFLRTACGRGEAPLAPADASAPVPPASGHQLKNSPVNDELDVLASVVPIDGRAIIEIGRGAAKLARALLNRYPHSQVTGLEVDVRRHAKNLASPQAGPHFVAGGAQAIPFQDASFDVALMLKSLHRVPAPLMAQALAEIARVLRPHGHLYVSEPVYGGPLNDVIRLFNDEGVVRTAAQAALDAAIRSGAWESVAERLFEMPVSFRDFADFETRMMRPTFADHRIDDARLAEVEKAFAPHMTADGARFTRPMHVRVLRKRT